MSSQSSAAFLQTAKERRTYYALEKRAPIPNSKIQEIVESAILHSPSSFNSQTTRVVILLNAEHEKLWDLTKEVLRVHAPPDSFEATEKKLNGFKGAYGTILFFEDQAIVRKMQENFALYRDKFPIWSDQTCGIHQYVVWTALEAEGLGANLQHYDPLIDEKVAQTWDVPTDWKLNAQMVIGTPKEGSGEPKKDKAFKPLEERLKVYGA